eukprot:221624_1
MNPIYKCIPDLKVGDRVYNDSLGECVIKYEDYPSYPIKLMGEWVFPMDVSTSAFANRKRRQQLVHAKCLRIFNEEMMILDSIAVNVVDEMMLCLLSIAIYIYSRRYRKANRTRYRLESERPKSEGLEPKIIRNSL